MSTWKSKVLVVVLLLVAGTGAAGYFYKKEALSRYHAWRMTTAPTDALDSYVIRFDELGDPGVVAVVSVLCNKDQTICTKATHVLNKLYQVWPAPSPRRQHLFACLAERAPEFSSSGQQACLMMLKDLSDSPEAIANVGQVLQGMMQLTASTSEQKLAMLELMSLILGQESAANSELIRHAKNMVASGLRDTQVSVRLAAIRLAVNPVIQQHDQLVPFLSKSSRDPSGEVRQLALLAMGEYQKLISTDEVCLLLLDEDEEVQQTAERVLKVRGLSPAHIKLAKLMNDPLPASRAEVPALVLGSSDLDTYLWMERLTRDPDPAVRAATARAMAQIGDDRLTSLLKKLSEEDRDPTVQQVARYYWKP